GHPEPIRPYCQIRIAPNWNQHFADGFSFESRWRCVNWFQAVVNEHFQAEDDWQVIQQNLTAIAEMSRLRAYSLAALDQSMQLLRMIDDMNGPLIRAPDDGAGMLDTGANAKLCK